MKLMHKRLVLLQINDEIFKEKKIIKGAKSVFGMASTRYNKCCCTMWHGVKQILNIFFWKQIPHCLYEQSKFIFWSCRMRITSETLTNQISHVLNGRHIRRISRPKKKLHALDWTEDSNNVCNMRACIILLKKEQVKQALKEWNDFGL